MEETDLKSAIQNRVKPSGFRAWMLAARPKTLVGAAVPVLLGCALAWSNRDLSGILCEVENTIPALLCLLFAFLMQINANFINDLWDFHKGSDREDRLGPKRACAQGWITAQAMQKGILLTTIAASLIGCGLLFFGGWWLIAVGAACLLFAFLYTAGPYPLAYHGWGDLLVLLFFGFVPVGCTHYVLGGAWSWQVIVVSAACGVAIDTLLIVNNYRDIEQDARSGKRTLIVRFGAPFGEWLYLFAGMAAAGLSLLLQGDHPNAWLPLLYLIVHTITWRRMIRIGHGRMLNTILGETSRNILLFGALLAIGLL